MYYHLSIAVFFFFFDEKKKLQKYVQLSNDSSSQKETDNLAELS